VAEFPFYRPQYALAVSVAVACQGEVGLQVFLHQAVEHGVLGAATAMVG
jgi:hypothetical protein